MPPQYATPPPHRPNRATFWRDSIYYARVDGLPAKADSTAVMAAAAALQQANIGNTHIRVDSFKQANWDGGNSAGYFCDTLPAGTTAADWYTTWDEYDANPNVKQGRQHIYFPDLRQQLASKQLNIFLPNYGGYAYSTFGDRHAVCWCEADRELFECIGYDGFRARCENGVTYDLDSYDMPVGPNGTTPVGAIVIRIPVAPFMFTYQDLLDCGSSGDLGHMLGFPLTGYRNARQWPARATDGMEPDGPVAGEVIRLPASYNAESLPSPPGRAFARTLKKYGAMLYDTGGQPKFLTPNEPTWPQAFTNEMGTRFQLTAFETVNISSIAGPLNSIRVASAPGPSNNPPVAAMTFGPPSGIAPLTVDFDSSGSTDGDGTIVTRAWNFGDGSFGSGTAPSHTYTTPGVYTPTVTVTDDDGASDSATGEADISFVPAYPLDTPPDKVRFGVSFDGAVASKWETPNGKPIAMYRRFFSWAQALNGNMRTELLANHALGRATWLSFKTPTTTTSWADVAAGDFQAQVDAFLNGLRTTGINVWLTPYHEPEDNCDAEAPGNGKELSGTAAEWRAMTRYIEARRQAVGATNVLIVPVLMAITFTSGSRDEADWVLPEADFPLYGIDPYTNDWASSPARLTSTSFNGAVASLEASGKDIAIAECGGAIGTTNVRPVGLWAGFEQECLDHDIKACCWFDFGNNLTNASPGDPSGVLYARILQTLDSDLTYREGLTGSGGGGGGGSTVTVTSGGGLHAPTAVMVPSTVVGDAPLTVEFDGSTSFDSDGYVVTDWEWDFDDGGATAIGAAVEHTYTTPGVYSPVLTVISNDLVAYREVTAFGDSLTAFDDQGGIGGGGRWTDRLVADQVVAYERNFGYPGATTEWFQPSWPNPPFVGWQANPPLPLGPVDLLVVFFGANDVNTGAPTILADLVALGLNTVTSAEYNANLDWFLANYPANRQVVVYPWRWRQITEDPGNPFYLPTGVPVDEPTYIAYRDAAAQAASDAGAAFVDMGVIIPDTTAAGVVTDWVHANVAGHQAIADAIAAAL